MRQSETDVAEQLNALPRLGIEALRALWVELFGKRTPDTVLTTAIWVRQRAEARF